MDNHTNALYDKLNNVHASLRKQKEDALRTKQLAEKRLQIVRSDHESLKKKGLEMNNSLRQLNETAGTMKDVNGKMEVENRQMEKEYNFQHAELQGKREKLTRLVTKRNIEMNGRHHSHASARDGVRRLRENSSSANNDDTSDYAFTNLSTEFKRRKLTYVMEASDNNNNNAGGSKELCKNLPELVRLRTAQKAEAVKDMEHRVASLRRIIDGYQNALGGTANATAGVRVHEQGGMATSVLQQ